MLIREEEASISHYGIKRKSGRYPWGSGDTPYQRSTTFQAQLSELRSQGVSESNIAKMFGMTTTDLRATIAIAKNAKRREDESTAQRLRDKGMSTSAIGRQMGINESSVRSLLDPARKARNDVLETVANMLESKVDGKNLIDIGLGTETNLGISKEKLAVSVSMLKEKGYEVHAVQIEQAGMPGKYTDYKVLAPPGTTRLDVFKRRNEIQTLSIYSEDGGRDFKTLETPKSVASKRIDIRYGKDGGSEMDGVIELRPGVGDLSLGGKRYAQVRISVDDTHYLKGMAVYADDLPKGIDIRFNTKKDKSESGSKLDAMKPLKGEEDNPFGSIIRQRTYVDKNGKTQLSAINVLGSKEGSHEEGGWDTWSRRLSSQMLSKQAPQLAKQQLDLTYRAKKEDLDDIISLTNPAVKKKLLQSFSDSCDADASKLAAAALPRQSNKVILPLRSMKDNEIYAPTYNNGEKVVLIRHPHGGTFEIPELTVNNRQLQARKLFGDIKDAVVINSKVAARLSGADFDGDTVIVIPNNHNVVKTSRPLKGLEGFDPQTAYPEYTGMKILEGKAKQKEMGAVSNLITDMTIKGANQSEIARAVRHSMVVIDAEKHKLNYKLSAQDNGIAQLKEKYQTSPLSSGHGASTIISRASSEARVPERTPRRYTEGGPINRVTGEKMYTPTGKTYTKVTISKRTGLPVEKTITKITKSDKMSETKDAFKLTSGHDSDMESIYAIHANRLKSLANESRLSMINTPIMKYSPSANKAYHSEVSTLQAKLNIALKNKPLERQAQLLARAEIDSKLKANKNREPSEIKKIRNQAITKARARVGTQKSRIEITPREWEAIQAGAISNHRLDQILLHTDDSIIRQYATPYSKVTIPTSKLTMARTMAARGYLQSEIAAQIGVSVSTLNKALAN